MTLNIQDVHFRMLCLLWPSCECQETRWGWAATPQLAWVIGNVGFVLSGIPAPDCFSLSPSLLCSCSSFPTLTPDPPLFLHLPSLDFRGKVLKWKWLVGRGAGCWEKWEKKKNQCSTAIFRQCRFLSSDFVKCFGAEQPSTFSSFSRCPIAPKGINQIRRRRTGSGSQSLMW